MLGTIITFIIVGAIAGFLARAIMPGHDSMGTVATVLLGIAGSFVGGFLFQMLFKSATDSAGTFSWSSVIGAVVGAVVLLAIYRLFTRENRAM